MEKDKETKVNTYTSGNPEVKRTQSEVAKREEETLKFWQENKIFEKTLAKPSDKGEFVFYEGPPTANAKPALHHLEARAFKDIIPRYKTMRGFHVRRKGGWDTHGLPVELQIEKKLGFKSKKDIEEYGVEAFNKECRDSVFEYIGDWEKFTDRIGYWVDKDSAYYTLDASYMESVWNILKTVDDKKFLYKDFKVLPWCPRDETALSSHELALGYQEDKDLSVTVKFKIKAGQKIREHEVKADDKIYILSWTTTPWTLPGNVALAVGDKIRYKALESGDEYFIVAADRFKDLGFTESGKSFELSGSELVGLEYEPLYPFLVQKFGDKNPEAFAKAYKVYAADFVKTDEGTGVVHTAVMYGQDDFVLGTKIGLPKFHLVNEQGKFIEGMGFLSGRFVKEMDENGKPTVAVDIIDDLKKKGLFFSQENIKHQYPHCWRCKTPLLYYARDSWYIRMSSLRDELVKENEGINWEPAHIKEGRFGEWLSEVKDWAISRERYWGTPLPVWLDTDGNYRVVGSVGELKKLTKKSGNKYFVMRHGQAENNVLSVASVKKDNPHHLTEVGKEQVRKSAEHLKGEKITKVISSPFVRTIETAEIVCDVLGIPKENIVLDERLGEHNVGMFNNEPLKMYHDFVSASGDYYNCCPEGGETIGQMKNRAGEFLYQTERKYTDENVLIVTHEDLGWVLFAVAGGLDKKGTLAKDSPAKTFMGNAEVRALDFVPLPHNDNYELDLHKPYIDSVQLVDENGQTLTRAKEVMDVWFDSGSMPFAQDHYPFENKEWIDGSFLHRAKGYPADFISEAIDQTRGWFYTLHAIGVLTGHGKAFKNVVCLGHILDKEGKKMSKSIGNILDPWVLMDAYGVDALRLWMYSVNQPGDSKNFDERTVDEVVKKVFNPTNNILAFYELYRDDSIKPHDKSQNVLDRWILSRLNQLVSDGTKSLEAFQIFEASRGIRDFVNDFSTWYIRRSRDRFKSDNVQEKSDALSTTGFVLLELMKYMAPFTPFFAEEIYRKIKKEGDPESVHLCDWPKIGNIEKNLMEEMEKVRKTVTAVLEARSKAGIKVRQPLASLVVKESLTPELRTILAEEVNVKEVTSDESLESPFELDITVTPELKMEGNVRDLIRAVQDARKTANLTPSQSITLKIETDEAGKNFVESNSEAIKKPTNVGDFEFIQNSGEQFEIENLKFKIEIQ